MSKFPTAISVALHEDDKNGLETLYGKDTSGFPHNGEKALNDDEVRAISGTLESLDLMASMSPGFEKSVTKSIDELADCEPLDPLSLNMDTATSADFESVCHTTEVRNRMTSQMNGYFSMILNSLNAASYEDLLNFRQQATSQLYTCQRMLAVTGRNSEHLNSFSTGMLSNTCTKWNEVRNAVIDNQGTR